MNKNKLEQGLREKIPIPFSQRWKEVRVRIFPMLVFVLIAGVVAYLWSDRIDATRMSGMVVGVQAEVRSPQAGSLADVSVRAFDSVSAGDPLGRLITTDPAILESELAVILAEIELLRLSMDPFADQQRNLLNFESMQIDLIQHEARRSITEIRKQQAFLEFQRKQRLSERGLTTEQLLEQAETEYRALAEEVSVMKVLIARMQERLNAMNLEDVLALWQREDPRGAALEVQRKKMEQITTRMMPVTLRAPVDGQIAQLHKVNGEFVDQGEIILEIRSSRPEYILGHIRHPVLTMPEPGMEVIVTRQTRSRDQSVMQISDVGVQMEVVREAVSLFPDRPFETTGLPVRIALNDELNLIPGEIVDIRMVR